MANLHLAHLVAALRVPHFIEQLPKIHHIREYLAFVGQEHLLKYWDQLGSVNK
ncbi:MAG: hypothetical protein ABH886_05925 [Candidatus Desantisbacteria bacterium]